MSSARGRGRYPAFNKHAAAAAPSAACLFAGGSGRLKQGEVKINPVGNLEIGLISEDSIFLGHILIFYI
ncbi:hypothetical protein [Paenibacillus lutrae]|uniref:Uncharacterized protein n=1 Tax=Paenibacillus lutrae TaxID=2078573 RepID=A0A7X3FI24_9BACL|nr:hypothetical protein [Paenibacillus lutrae]MVP00110.1 hypothetical protein [Paenibacillus lutrae]